MGQADQPTSLSRRTLMKTGLVGVVLVGAGSASLALRQTVLREAPAAGLKVLSTKEYAVLAAVADRVCPDLGPGAPGATAAGVPTRADGLLAKAPAEAQQSVKVLLGVFDNALTGALFGERVAPFTQLPPQDQDRVLQGWRGSSVAFRRTAYKALFALCTACYFSEPSTWARTGYPGPPSPGALRTAYSFNLVDFDALTPGAEADRANEGALAPPADAGQGASGQQKDG